MLEIVLQKEIDKHLEKHPGAKEFIVTFADLCHAVDDLIDRDNPEVKDYKLHVLDCFGLASDVYSCWFYHQNHLWLYPIVKNTHRVYSDSIVWEHSEVQWKREYADKLRCCGNELLLAVLEHLCHVPAADIRRISIGIREHAWERGHDAEGRPV